jgi:hypothetical protein
VRWNGTALGRRPHDLRHTAASLWIAAGVDIKTVSQRATDDLDRGLDVVSNLMTLTRPLPCQLLATNAVHAPAKSLRATEDRLRAREHGRYVHARSGDVADLATAWEAAARSISGQARVPNRDTLADMTL